MRFRLNCNFIGSREMIWTHIFREHNFSLSDMECERIASMQLWENLTYSAFSIQRVE